MNRVYLMPKGGRSVSFKSSQEKTLGGQPIIFLYKTRLGCSFGVQATYLQAFKLCLPWSATST